jgi:outer membrane lipoprotein-sorting protein
MAILLRRTIILCLAASLLTRTLASLPLAAQQPDPVSIIQHIDATVKARVDTISSYTVTENYVVYRNNDETHPAAEMTVHTVYRKESGKSYTIVSQSGSQLIQKFVLNAILDNEKTINLPTNRPSSWITSANYQMQLKPGGVQKLNGRDCFVLSLTPKRKAPYLIEGTLWVDSKDYSIVQIQGTGSKSPSFFSGPTQMMRQYANVSGFAQATHARAVSSSFMFGPTVVTIDYKDYAIQVTPSK